MEDVKVNDDIKVNDEVAEENQEQPKESNLNHLKTLLESDLECKGYIDSLIDKTVSKRLEKRIKAYEEQQKIKADEEKRISAEQQKIKDYEKEISLLKSKIAYSKILEESGLNSNLLKFLSVGVESNEDMQNNIKIFKDLLRIEVQKELKKKFVDNPIPENSEGEKSNKKNKLWNI